MEGAPVSRCDLLIIGAGPAGLMAATWAARCNINARIIEKSPSRIRHGHADGLQSRTLEILDSFGIASKILEESNPLLERRFWQTDETDSTAIRRSGAAPNGIAGISRYHEATLQQGRIEQLLLDSLAEHSGIRVERHVAPERLMVDETALGDHQAYPISVGVRRLDTKEQDCERVHAKYLVASDGAHSWTRQQLGLRMEGEQTEILWGVLDIIPITDFPDIRMVCNIHSSEHGSMLVIPREMKLVRLYVQLPLETERASISKNGILQAARRILNPYRLDFVYCDWWTSYPIKQQICDEFTVANRIFLTGDAVHTHSPKAGQGMNVSMQDSYNLGWKIALVMKGLAKPSILETYQSERRPIAVELIAFDHRYSRLFSGVGAGNAAAKAGFSVEDVRSVFTEGLLFASGLSNKYGPSVLVAESKTGAGNQQRNAGPRSGVDRSNETLTIIVGMRFPSYQVLNASDARPWDFGHLLKSDGRFRVILFAGDLSEGRQRQRIEDFCTALDSPSSCMKKYGPAIELLTIYSGKRTAVDLLSLPEILHPFDPETGWDYDKVFADDVSHHKGHGEAYKNYGVDRERGCAVLVRPDQHVGWHGEVEEVEEIDSYFSAILNPQSVSRGPNISSIVDTR